MSDLISRQAAIDMFQNLAYDDWNQGAYTSWADAYSEAADMIRDLPSAQPERKRGRWRRRLVDSGFNADWHCSECGWKTSLEEHGYNFCPNCGCRMEEGDSE